MCDNQVASHLHKGMRKLIKIERKDRKKEKQLIKWQSWKWETERLMQVGKKGMGLKQLIHKIKEKKNEKLD